MLGDPFAFDPDAEQQPGEEEEERADHAHPSIRAMVTVRSWRETRRIAVS